MNARRAGFTLIELLIVVVIIGILATIAIPKFTSVRERAFLATIKADLRNLANLEDVYYNSNYTYTSSLTDLVFTSSEGVVITIPEADQSGWSVTAYHVGLPSESCGLYHGSAAPVTPATVVSSVMCSR